MAHTATQITLQPCNDTCMRTNKWGHGLATFELSALPTALGDAEGIAPLRLTLAPDIGQEVVLLWLDRTPFINELVGLTPFDLRLKSGLVRTSLGPLLFLLFYVPNPARPDDPIVAIDVHIDPTNRSPLSLWVPDVNYLELPASIILSGAVGA
jgi:hypothetical protein